MASLDQEALSLVEQCIDLDPAARSRFVTERCGSAATLRAKVEQLLAMDRTQFRFAQTEGPPIETFEPPLPEQVGNFRVTGTIGRGGMGVVAKGERSDGLYEQTVAIKLIRGDLRDARAAERFASERRILARLDHPGVARILDGGEAEGRPYLVMEFVDGEPITQALAGRQSGLDDTLSRFEAVCEVVGHAHRNLIVHADIKPSNAMISADGSVKLLDFGIAHLLAEIEPTSAEGGHPLTPGYAAPERREGDAPTVVSDVYSLGALLHELLTGELPDRAGRAASAVAPADGRIPAKSLRGDLDAIVARATAADPADRYPDVAALTADLQRYRNRMPVHARAAGWRYRSARFVARHRRGLAVTALAMAALLAAIVTTTIMYVEAERARAEAERRFGEVRGLARFMLFDLYDELRNAPGTVGARVALAETGGRYLDRLRQVPDAPADLRLDTASGYRRLATVQGVSGTASLGDSQRALASLGSAEELVRSVLAEQPESAAALEEMGWILANRWTLAPPTEGGLALRREARRFFDAALAIDKDRLGARLGRLSTERMAAFDLIWADRPAEALPVLRGALSELRATRWSPAEAGEARQLEFNLLSRLGDAVYYSGDMPGALPIYQEASALVARELAARETAIWLALRGEAMWNLAGTLTDLGRPAAALAPARDGIAAMRRLLASGPDSLAENRLQILLAQESTILDAIGRRREAMVSSTRGVELREARLRREPGNPQRMSDLAAGMRPHADLLARIGDRRGACGAARRAMELWDNLARRSQLSDLARTREVPLVKSARDRYCAA